ncbi:MAG TPA: glycosyltransferase, partial [Stellaceae bacterium]|nr:glycosyltransferase [Stellaceae bacterium]
MRTIQEQYHVSAVIPTLDAASELPRMLAALADSPLVGEIVVVDGGSRDESVAIARAAGVRVIEAPRGRGSQFAAGAVSATGEWLLFLHADCRPLPGWEDAVRAFIARLP